MKIALLAVAGSYSHTNLAIRCLRAPLLAAGFEVELIEGSLGDTDGALLDRLFAAHADIYGFSSYIWNIKRMLSLASDIKTLCPDAAIVFGGPEVSFETERFDSCEFIDTIICGEGERAMTEVCELIRNGKKPPRIKRAAEHILNDGILYAHNEPSKKLLYYESSRGCPYSCAYCLSSADKGVRAKPAEQATAELYEFEKFDGERVIKLVDRTFNFDRTRANAIWRALLDEKYTKQYHFEICASLLDEESFEILSRFPRGKVRLEIGLQSTNRETLALGARHIDPDEVLSACRRLYDMGNLVLHLDIICGLPGDTLADIKNAFDRAYPVCTELQVGFLKLLCGTALRRDSEALGIKYRKEPPYEVLETKTLSYSELRRLHEISDLVERYRDGEKFSRSLPAALSLFSSPFEFFNGLLEYIERNDGRPIRKIGQADAFSLLFGFATESGADQTAFEALLHADFCTHEVRGMPRFLKEGEKR